MTFHCCYCLKTNAKEPYRFLQKMIPVGVFELKVSRCYAAINHIMQLMGASFVSALAYNVRVLS